MIEIERCPKCNANLAMVGRSHRCVPMPEWAGGVPKSSDVATETRQQARPEAKLEKGREKPKSLPSAVAQVAGPSEAKPKKKRAPPGTFDRKAYQRELMRRRRQKEKAK